MLTSKQNQLLLYIDQRLKDDGVSPSFDEMKDALGLKSKSGVHRLIKALEERGFIRRLPNRARALEVLNRSPAHGAEPTARVIRPDWSRGAERTEDAVGDMSATIPLHGRIAAGTPIEAIEHADSQISVPMEMLTHDNYALEVSGDSMIEAGILDGDTVIIERCQTARDGEIVVALVEREEATLKELKRQGDEVVLIPANQNHKIQIYPSRQVEVQGRLVGLLRRY